MNTNQAVTYQCPNCSAGLSFKPDKQKFCCEFCLSEFTEQELKDTATAYAAEAAAGEAAERAGVADMAEGVAGFDANGAAPFYPEDLTGDTAPAYSYSQQLNAEVNEVREQIEQAL